MLWGMMVDPAWGVEPPSCGCRRPAPLPQSVPRTGRVHPCWGWKAAAGQRLSLPVDVALTLQRVSVLEVCRAGEVATKAQPRRVAPRRGVGRGGRGAEPPQSMVKARYHRFVGFLSLPGPLLNRSTSLGSTPLPPPPRETDLQGIRTEAIGYREPDPPPDIYLASHSGSRPLDSLHKTFNRDGCRRNQFQVVRHVHIGLAVTDPTRDFHGGRCTSASGL